MREISVSIGGTEEMSFRLCALRESDCYALHPFTNSTRLRSAIPDGPLAIHGLFSSIHAVPAISRWIQGVSSANSLRNMAAKIAPPQRLPELTISAMFDLRFSLYSSSSGRRHIFSPAC